jgi:hypothetical protein
MHRQVIPQAKQLVQQFEADGTLPCGADSDPGHMEFRTVLEDPHAQVSCIRLALCPEDKIATGDSKLLSHCSTVTAPQHELTLFAIGFL